MGFCVNYHLLREETSLMFRDAVICILAWCSRGWSLVENGFVGQWESQVNGDVLEERAERGNEEELWGPWGQTKRQPLGDGGGLEGGYENFQTTQAAFHPVAKICLCSTVHLLICVFILLFLYAGFSFGILK